MSISGLPSQRERDVLRIISLGGSSKIVAQYLSISPSTVRTHVESALPQAGVLGASYGDAKGYVARPASAQRSGQAQAWRSLMCALSVAEIEQV
ncbi:LuxR C-terminal-related transcriptional regulator [Lysobacter antibioticus]|uniref:LuxR C-terminal-related transcriptional regulator n=1 Tax=Lysobacter antibioticus TaxID=84531 RepID=UPI003CCE3CE2